MIQSILHLILIKWIMPDGYLGLFIPTDDFEKRFAFVQTLV